MIVTPYAIQNLTESTIVVWKFLSETQFKEHMQLRMKKQQMKAREEYKEDSARSEYSE